LVEEQLVIGIQPDRCLVTIRGTLKWAWTVEQMVITTSLSPRDEVGFTADTECQKITADCADTLMETVSLVK
jgi:hypothetical protein